MMRAARLVVARARPAARRAYTAPLKDMRFALEEVHDFEKHYATLLPDRDDVNATRPRGDGEGWTRRNARGVVSTRRDDRTPSDAFSAPRRTISKDDASRRRRRRGRVAYGGAATVARARRDAQLRRSVAPRPRGLSKHDRDGPIP